MIHRRDFTKAGVAATALAASHATSSASVRAPGPNDKVRLGFIGVGNRGGQLLASFAKHADGDIAVLCDVYEPYRDRAKAAFAGAETEKDFRRVLERRDLDAVVIATPDHWHAIQTIAACRAGKDVYVEKPLSITIREGRRMVEVAREEKRIVQVGTHRRSSKLYAQLAEFIAAGKLGKVTVSRAYRITNMSPNGIGRAAPGDPPPGLDWDMWLGPRPLRPFQATIAPYKFRWWDLYSSQIANWGVHYFDAIRWLTGDAAPTSICAMGGKFALDDDRTIPDTLEATVQFASGRLAIFGQYEASGAPALLRGEVELRGTLGTVFVDDRGAEIVPDAGGQFQDRAPRMKPQKLAANEGDFTDQHTRNFLDCVKSRERPTADVEEGHRSTTISLLGNISLAVGERLAWDAEKERITNHPAANDLLHYEYRRPWELG
ncbi:MAG: gfo/Idh/MocA family oxidoreductase [Planctomycetota bacterium]|nr:MAG: gfo/Idh/MocA family oxidoreductase [Planctomycetota bacterium]